MAERADTIRLEAEGAEATIALRGAEPVAWRVGGIDRLWTGDPAHWAYSAPILFPVVGASKEGRVLVDGEAYPMPQHGVARISHFDVVNRTPHSVHLRLTDTAETRGAYPFAFRFDVVATLSPTRLHLAFTVANTGERAMPYGLGFHPAFPWPLDGGARPAHRVRFAQAERGEVPEVAPGGLLARHTRTVPLDGAVLPLDPDLFSEALVFLDANSRFFAFEDPSGAAIRMTAEDFPHLAVWSRPTAPFLSLEAWTSHADWQDASGDLAARASTITLPPGGSRRHGVALDWCPA